MRELDLAIYIKDFPDFPQKGIVFRDISPLLDSSEAFTVAIDRLVAYANEIEFDKIVAVDARGFIFGGALADRTKKGLVLCRKASKLPGELVSESYGYEYSSDSLSLQKSAVHKGDRVLIIDDVLATGNTALAAYKLVDKLGGVVPAIFFLIELDYLPGRELLTKEAKSTKIQSVILLES